MHSKSKYQLIIDDIVGRIESGEWQPGARLPSEATLAENTGVSVGTVQRSLRTLESEGIIVKRHGSGSYVSTVPTQNEVFNHIFVAGDFAVDAKPLPLYIKVLDVSKILKQGPWTRLLQHSGETIKVSRIINVNLDAQLFTEMYLEKRKFEHLLTIHKSELHGAAFIRAMYGANQLPPKRFTYEMSVSTPPARAAQQMQVSPDMPSLKWETLAYDHRDFPLFYSVTYVPPSAQRLRIEVNRTLDVDKSLYSVEAERARKIDLNDPAPTEKKNGVT